MSEKKAPKKKALGRGLGALIPRKTETVTKDVPAPPAASEDKTPLELPLSSIEPMPNQPRVSIDAQSLEDLTESIREKGVLQPIMVRPVGEGRYQIILGERRFRASGLAGKTSIPAVIRETDDEEAYVLAVVENVQREDLNPIEISRALHRLRAEYGLTQKQVAERLGKPRSTIANYERLLDLPEEVRKLVEKGVLSFGHAKVLGSFSDKQWNALDKARLAEGGYSVRDLENLSSSSKQTRSVSGVDTRPKLEDPQIKSLKQMIQRQLNGMPVDLKHKENGKGKLVIHYKDLDEFDYLMQRMGFRVK